jgi:hypothetical protein
LNIFFIYEEFNKDTIGWTILSIICAAYAICILSYLFSLIELIVRKAITWYKKRKINNRKDIEEPNDPDDHGKNCEELEVSPGSKTELNTRYLEDIQIDIDNTKRQQDIIDIDNTKYRPENIDTGSNLFTMSIQNTDEIQELSQSLDSSSHRVDRPEWKFDIKNGTFKLKENENLGIEKIIGMPEDISAIYDIGIKYLVETKIYTENSRPKVQKVRKDKLISSEQTDSSFKIRDFNPVVYSDSKISTKPHQHITTDNPIRKL